VSRCQPGSPRTLWDGTHRFRCGGTTHPEGAQTSLDGGFASVRTASCRRAFGMRAQRSYPIIELTLFLTHYMLWPSAVFAPRGRPKRESGAASKPIPELPRSGNRERPAPRH
jgi:hypothetical protein